MSDVNAAKLSSIKTYVLVAFIFEILVIVGFFFEAFTYLVLLTAVRNVGIYGSTAFNVVFGIFGVFFLIAAVLSLLVLMRTNKMRGAANTGDIAKLKSLNSVGWAIIALLFSGIIPGIFLLISNGPINELTTPAGAPSV